MASPIDSVSTHIAETEKIKKVLGLAGATVRPWYRGQSQVGRHLVPSMYRCEVKHNLERELIRDFKQSVRSVINFSAMTEIDWLFLAQHHGLPTRILDWTENPLVALFFATEKFDNKKDAEMFVLNPWTLNKAVKPDFQSVPTTDSSLFKEYVIDHTDVKIRRAPDAKSPMAFRLMSQFKRSTSQSGVFTIHGHEQQGIDQLGLGGLRLERLVVSAARKEEIFNQLNEMNINRGTLFGTQTLSPELSGIDIRS